MRIYTVHLRRTADPLFTPDRDALFVREGFNFPAFVFTWMWALATGQWIVAAILAAAGVALALIVDAVGLDATSVSIVTLGSQAVVGFIAEDLRRWSLRLRGFALTDVVAAESVTGAERRFFEHHPAMAKAGWR